MKIRWSIQAFIALNLLAFVPCVIRAADAPKSTEPSELKLFAMGDWGINSP